MEMKILDLPLMFVWYDMIYSGEKLEEYREIKHHWIKRIMKCVKWCSKGVVRSDISKDGIRYCYDNLATGKKLCYSYEHGAFAAEILQTSLKSPTGSLMSASVEATPKQPCYLKSKVSQLASVTLNGVHQRIKKYS